MKPELSDCRAGRAAAPTSGECRDWRPSEPRPPVACRGTRCSSLLTLAVAAACCVLGGCTSHMAYRAKSGYLRKPAPGVTVSVIELDDHGELWSRPQLNKALGVINQAQGGTEGPGAIVVVFVHGWQNNASHGNEDDPNGNLYKFKKTLERVRDLEVQSTAANEVPRNVAGVYIGWRGESIHPFLGVQLLSFYNRYNTARRVAASPAPTEAILAVLKVGNANQRSRTVVIGHSFGGLIVEKALSQPLVDLATTAALAQLNAQGVSPVAPAQFPADLIVLVNPASPALFARSLLSSVEAWGVSAKERVDQRFACKGSARWRPLIVSVTSKGDSATGTAFPLGTTLGYSLQRYRDYDGKGPDDAPADNAKQGQRYYATHTEGHVEQLFSHTLDHQGAAPVSGEAQPCDNDPCAHPDVLCYRSGGSRFTLTRRTGTNNVNSPYWIMQAPVSLIADHSAIFVEPFVELLGGLLDVVGIVAPTSTAAPTAAHRPRAIAPGGTAPPEPQPPPP
jgi:pimeloyl-ACP methyl ester carboxylesterase